MNITDGTIIHSQKGPINCKLYLYHEILCMKSPSF